MAYEMREGQGSLFKNNLKKTDKHPNAQGECLIGGVVYRISAWTKKDKNGNPWQSLSFQKKEVDAKADSGIERDNDVDADIPF